MTRKRVASGATLPQHLDDLLTNSEIKLCSTRYKFPESLMVSSAPCQGSDKDVPTYVIAPGEDGKELYVEFKRNNTAPLKVTVLNVDTHGCSLILSNGIGYIILSDNGHFPQKISNTRLSLAEFKDRIRVYSLR